MIVIIGPAHPYRGGIADTNESLAKHLLIWDMMLRCLLFLAYIPIEFFQVKHNLAANKNPKELILKGASTLLDQCHGSELQEQSTK